jgi:hypothetical protein
MRKNYDFSNAVRNPYAKRLKRQLTIRLDEETIGYFQGLSREMSLPYQTLMNMYLRDCVESRMRPHWAVASAMKRANKPLKRSYAVQVKDGRSPTAPARSLTARR